MKPWNTRKEPWLVWITHDTNTPGLHGWTTKAITAETREGAVAAAVEFIKQLRMRVRGVDLRKATNGLPGNHHASVKAIKRSPKEQKAAFMVRVESLRIGGKEPQNIAAAAFISGNTYPHRKVIRATGAKWLPGRKVWGYEGNDLSALDCLIELGLTVTPMGLDATGE